MQDPIGKCIKDLEFCVCHMTDICLTDKCFLPYLFKIPVGMAPRTSNTHLV